MLKLTLIVLGITLAAQARTRISRLPEPVWRIPKFRYVIDEKIVGGDEVTPHSIPYQVSLQDTSGFHFCGGSVASSRFIITAAHCCDGQTPNGLLVLAGKHDLSMDESTQQVGKVKSIHMHPLYNPTTIKKDICLLELKEPLILNEYVQDVILAEDGQSFSGSAVVSGWGTLASWGESPDKLHSVEVPLVSDKDCRFAYGASAIADSMICAGEGGKDSCQGDSGGPLTCGKFQCGVVSWGYGCAVEGLPGVYTEISHFATFLNHYLEA